MIADQQEAAGHHDRVGGEGVRQEPAAGAPIRQPDENEGQRQALPELDADVERHDVRNQPLRREFEVLELRRQAKPVEQAEDEYCQACVGLEPEDAPEAVHVFEGFVDDREADDRVDGVRVDLQPTQHPQDESNRVAHREESDVEGDLSEADVNKLSALEKTLRQQLREYRFASLPPDSLSISHDTFRPEHEKFDFEVNNSASDLIRMIWAYVNGLMEVARSYATNHPGLLIMDEPKQQGAHRRDLGTFLRRLATCAESGQQVIITTSEEADTFGPLVENLNCKVFDFESKILEPLPRP